MMRFLSAIVALTLTASLASAADVFKNPKTGTPKLSSIDVLAFGPNGALLIGDSKGAQVVAIDTKDTSAKPWKAGSVEKLTEKIAARLGTTAKNIEISHMAINPASGTAYLAVRKQDEAKSVIVTVDGTGAIGEFAPEKVSYVAVPLPKGEKAPVSRITDLSWAKGRILVGALASEEFASKVYSIPTPLDPASKATGFSTETYHVAHRRWETKAPMTTLMPYEQKGKEYVVGAFACTPVVRYPLKDVKQGAKVKGESVVELGNGNRPRYMFTYNKGDKAYVLINNYRMFHKRQPIGPSPYWVARVDLSIFDEQEKINEKALWRADRSLKPLTDRVKVVEPFHGTAFMGKLNDKQAMVIKEDGKGGWTLTALELP